MKKCFSFLKLDDCSLFSTSEARIISLASFSVGALASLFAFLLSFFF